MTIWADNWEWRPIAFGQHLQVISGKLRNLTTYSPTSNYGRLYIKLSRNIKNLNFIYSIPFFAFDKLGRFFIGMNNFDTKLCLNYIALGQISVKTGNSCISLHKCILDSPRSTIYLCCAFVKIDTKFELNFFHFNYSLNFQGFLCVSVDNCFVFCGTLFGHLSSLAHVCYGGLPKRSQSDKVCTMPKLVILDFFDLFGSFLAIWYPLHMFAMGDFQRGLRVIRYVPCQNWSFWTFLDLFDLFGSFLAIWHPLHMFAMGDFQRGSQSDKVHMYHAKIVSLPFSRQHVKLYYFHRV